MSWTEERVAVLTRLWNEGQSASQIAKTLGGVTRNAVIGKVHRLGLSKPTEAAKPASEDAVSDAPPATPVKTESAEPPKTAEVSKTAEEPAAASEEEEAAPSVPAVPKPPRTPQDFRALIAAGQPLPPQPSANEISAEALARVSEVERGALKLSLLELTERTCKWPIGDPATDDFWFCGLPVQPGKPYCEAHVGVAFQPMSNRRDRRR